MPPLRAVIWCAVSTKEQTAEDKHSLPQQEADGRALCELQGWQVIAVLTVPGHSRRYVDIHELAEHARAEGIDAFDRMLDLWQRCAFDVLICRDGDRFARTQSLHAYFVEKTIGIGARIYALSDGWIDEGNYRMWTSMSGYKAASHIDGLVKARQKGMEKRMERGLNGGTTIPMTHRIVRSENGKALRLEFREEYRQVMDDAAELLLDGVGWKAFAMELYIRYGHANPKTGQPYHDNTFYRLFHNPITWGVTAKNYANRYGLWAFDEREPLPDGVKVNRAPNPPIPPTWMGETADLIKAELHRRVAVAVGRGRSDSKYAFTGLLVCASCGRRMAVDASKGKRFLYWRCSSHTYRHHKLNAVCTNRKQLRDDVAEDQIDDFLKRYLRQNRTELKPPVSNDGEAKQKIKRAADLRHKIVRLKAEIDALIVSQAKAPENVRDRYTRLIEQASGRLTRLENDLRQAESAIEPPAVKRARQLAYDQVTRIGLESFWQLPPQEINEILHRFMGRHRFVVQDGAIIDIR
jgi:DNA invertase Pin-like site-specific DNA recombinase